MNTVKIAIAATAAVALILLASCGGGGKKTLKAGIPESGADSVSFTDARDGQKYRTVKIGERVWMAENLNFVTDSSWCYDNDAANCTKYGRLYNWNAATKACPAGWKLPSSDEWDNLRRTIGNLRNGDSSVVGKELKSKIGWNYDGNGTDEYGFSALPGGAGFCCDFDFVGYLGFWWSATENDAYSAWLIGMKYDSDSANIVGTVKKNRFSVRCVQYCDPQ